MKYQVIVGNIGTVYDGNSPVIARQKFRAYRTDSMCGYGRASHEPVTLMEDGQPVKEYAGKTTRKGHKK